MGQIQHPIRNEEKAVVQRICEISGENIFKCMQCGTCSAVCPMVESMGLSTRQGIHLLQFGRAQEVIDAEMGEICAACHTCTVRCPRGIDVARVYEAVRQITLRQNIDFIKPQEIPKELMARAPQIAFVSAFRKLTS